MPNDRKTPPNICVANPGTPGSRSNLVDVPVTFGPAFQSDLMLTPVALQTANSTQSFILPQTSTRLSNNYDVSQGELTIIEMDKKNFVREFWEKLSLDTFELGMLAFDGSKLKYIIDELGIDGLVKVSVKNGKTYLIIKGYAGKRAVITGTRYLVTHPKVAPMMSTAKQITGNAVKGTSVMLFLYTGYHAIDEIFFQEDPSLSRFLGATISNSLKAAASYAVGALFAMGVAGAVGVSTLAAGPVIVAIVTGIAAGAVLDGLDEKYQLTAKLTAAIDSKLNELAEGPREFNRQWNLWEKYLKDAAIDGTLHYKLRAIFGG